MPWALKFPADSGSVNTNNKLVQITGIVGTLATVRYTLHEPIPAYIASRGRYIFDIRRLPNSTANGGGTGFLAQFGGTSTIESSGTSAWKINGASVAAADLFNPNAIGDVCEFNVNSVPSSGCIAFGARFNEIEHFYGLAIRNIVIVDGAGTHTIDMSSSGGTSNTFTSTDGAVTLTLFNFSGTAHWVFYSSGDSVSSSAAWTLNQLRWQSSAAVTAPTFSSSAAWSITPINWQGSAAATVPVFQSSAAWSITPLQWQAQAASTAPGAIASAAAWTISPLQWQAQAQPAPVFQSSAEWSISPMRWQSTAAATVPQFQSSAAWSVSPLQWQGFAAAAAPGATASTVNWSISPPQWQSTASATVPTFTASAAWQITPMVWRVSASIAGEPVFTAKGASITERFQSRAIIERLQTARIIQ